VNVRVGGPASEELGEAVRWYEDQSQGLGVAFLEAVQRVISRIKTHPEIGAIITDRQQTRRLRQRNLRLHRQAQLHDLLQLGFQWREDPDTTGRRSDCRCGVERYQHRRLPEVRSGVVQPLRLN